MDKYVVHSVFSVPKPVHIQNMSYRHWTTKHIFGELAAPQAKPSHPVTLLGTSSWWCVFYHQVWFTVIILEASMPKYLVKSIFPGLLHYSVSTFRRLNNQQHGWITEQAYWAASVPKVSVASLAFTYKLSLEWTQTLKLPTETKQQQQRHKINSKRHKMKRGKSPQSVCFAPM